MVLANQILLGQLELCGNLSGLDVKRFFMNCLICRQAEIIDGLTSITFEREEFRLLINNVPAWICPNCGESLVDEDVAIRLLSVAEDVINEGIFEDIRDYGK
jgi:YgiT-type zinc finger domain-containing protein